MLYNNRYVKVEELRMNDTLYEDRDVLKINEEMHAFASRLYTKKSININVDELCCDEMESLYKETYDILNHDEIEYKKIHSNCVNKA